MTETTEALESEAFGGESPVSQEIGEAIAEAVDRIDRIDRDPLIRQAVARVCVRRFNAMLAERFDATRGDIAMELVGVARLVRETPEAQRDAGRRIRAVSAPAEGTEAARAAPETDRTGGKTDAGDQEPAGAARGGGQADPQGSGPERGAGKGARDHGAERLGKIDSVLRIGGARGL
jgi:hypothetical protein